MRQQGTQVRDGRIRTILGFILSPTLLSHCLHVVLIAFAKTAIPQHSALNSMLRLYGTTMLSEVMIQDT